jgi:hypothetical protein
MDLKLENSTIQEFGIVIARNAAECNGIAAQYDMKGKRDFEKAAFQKVAKCYKKTVATFLSDQDPDVNTYHKLIEAAFNYKQAAMDCKRAAIFYEQAVIYCRELEFGHEQNEQTGQREMQIENKMVC